MHLRVKLKFLGATLVHPVRRQNFAGTGAVWCTLDSTTSETVSYEYNIVNKWEDMKWVQLVRDTDYFTGESAKLYLERFLGMSISSYGW